VAYEIVVCVKQVPDTENLTDEAMTAEGTVNRSALPAIINPEDLNALEVALQIKDAHGARITVITMGPPSAAEQLRQCLYRGADAAVLVTDRRVAASDTLATSYVLSCVVRKLPLFDLILCGRQAIDGDTAQIGPQLAEKLGIPQFTYVEEIRELDGDAIVVKRGLEDGYEMLRGPLPILLTVSSNANYPRPPAAKRLMKCKKARALWELGDAPGQRTVEQMRQRGLLIEQWSAEDIGVDQNLCGGRGSPTLVKKVESIRLVTEERKRVEPTAEALNGLIEELMDEHMFD
jgi:electron transfer flavoprotein beta subunit